MRVEWVAEAKAAGRGVKRGQHAVAIEAAATASGRKVEQEPDAAAN